VDVRIGIVQSIKELEVELDDKADAGEVIADIEKALEKDSGVLWLTDRKGRRVAVPVAKVAYIEVGPPVADRRVGFGAP
jgi:predicted nucleic acid-binding protein